MGQKTSSFLPRKDHYGATGKKSAGRSFLLWFSLYPAVENIPGEIIFTGIYTSPIQEAED
jgi:hypothetical protein